MTVEDFMASLAGDEPYPAEAVAVVVAHPDDETIGIGAQLPRLRGVTLVHVTDGAPRDLGDARAYGFATAADYAAARRRELEAAVRLAGAPADALVGLDVPDQEAAQNLAGIARRLAALFRERGIAAVVTHAYEGGHPDHDATAFAVHAAGALIAAGERPAIVEMPLYHAGPEGWVRQRFLPGPAAPDAPALSLGLTEEQQDLKRRMLAAHATQAQAIAPFTVDVERFRPAPAYDFTVLPNGGDLLYERYGWGMTGARWRDLARTALGELGLEARA